jgi:hypothetical protein
LDIRRPMQRVSIEVRVALGGRSLGVAEQLAHQRQPHPGTDAKGRERVTKIVEPDTLQPRAPADSLPGAVEVGGGLSPLLRSPGITYVPIRGSDHNNSSAGAFNGMVFFPLFESGSRSSPRSKSTKLHCRCRISRSRAPVNRSRRIAAVAVGEYLVLRSCVGTCLDRGLATSTFHGSPSVSASRSRCSHRRWK